MELVNHVLILAACLIASVDALMFHISPNQRKCLREEIHKDVLVTGDYDISEAPSQKASLKVTDSKGHVLYNKDEATKGKFAFTTEEYDMFEICLESKMTTGGHGADREVYISMKHGVEAKKLPRSCQGREAEAPGGGAQEAGGPCRVHRQ